MNGFATVEDMTAEIRDTLGRITRAYRAGDLDEAAHLAARAAHLFDDLHQELAAAAGEAAVEEFAAAGEPRGWDMNARDMRP